MSVSSGLFPGERNISGFLKSRSEWSEQVAIEIAQKDNIELTGRHWDVINFVRTEFYANRGIVPLERDIRRGMAKEWRGAVNASDIVNMFPGGSVQVAKIAGCITMTTVEDLLAVKGDAVWSIDPAQTVGDALVVLDEKDVGALMVVESNNLCGVISERDITRHFLLKGRASADTRVSEVMSVNAVSVTPVTTLDECMTLMVGGGFRHLPVLEHDRLAGVLSMPDLVKVIVEQQQMTIFRLTSQSTEENDKSCH